VEERRFQRRVSNVIRAPHFRERENLSVKTKNERAQPQAAPFSEKQR
jgi:hypothetical protein